MIFIILIVIEKFDNLIVLRFKMFQQI